MDPSLSVMFFDLDIFRKKFQLPVLEWRDVKILPNRDSDEVNSEVETIGCWTTVAENKKGVPEATRLVHAPGRGLFIYQIPALCSPSERKYRQRSFCRTAATCSGDFS